jgi:HAD superfamily hydrolase (TIGR01509 family)
VRASGVDWGAVDAVTLDAYGTLVRLVDPVPALVAALRDRGASRSRAQVERAFAAEVAYYGPRASEGRDAESLADLQRRSAAVFSAAVGAELDADAYVACLRFERIEGVDRAVETIRSRGIEVAVVANWDVSLHDRLAELGLRFRVVVPAARKPDPAALLLALERLGVAPRRSLHVGDDASDEEAARGAGMMFRWSPLSNTVG